MNVEMTDEQYQHWNNAQRRRGSRLWALWWGLLTVLVVAAMLMLAIDHFLPGIFSGMFQRVGFVIEQLPATVAPVPTTMAPLPTPYIPAPAVAPAIVVVVPTATPCTDTFYNAQSGRNECAGLGGGGGGSYGTPESEPPAPGEPGFVESFQPAPDNGAFVGCLTTNCNPGAVPTPWPTPWPTSSGPRPGQPGFADSFR